MQGQPSHSVMYRTLRLLEGVNGFAFSGTLLLVLLFVLGNYQEFLDRTQAMVLIVVSFLSLLAVSTGALYLGSLVMWMIRRRRFLLLRLLYGIAATGVSATVAVGIGLLRSAVRSA